MKGYCFECKQFTVLERHHIFGGKNRDNSEEYGLVVSLCHHCHNEPPNGVHYSKEFADRLKEYGQKKFEEENPALDFVEIFGKNYIEKDFMCPFAPVFRF